jgi:uncharacterized protein (DUF2141 family)
MDASKAEASTWRKVDATVECRFKDVAPGAFAEADSVDWTGNRKTDKNLFGIPTELWGISTRVHPSLRPPHFDEASAQMPEGDLRIEVKVAK